jgi:phytoene dehydrogenase-like protein
MVMDLSTRASGQRSAVIIGAGPGGLAASILLAAAGIRVRILERLPIVGGRTSTIEADGFRFDLGPTFFLYPRVLEEIMRAAGTTLAAEVELVRLDPQYRLIFGAGGQLDCTPDVAEMERQIATIAPGDAPGFARFLRENRRKLELMQPCLENAFHGWKDVLNTRLLRLLPSLRPHRSVDAYLRRFFADPRTRLAFSFNRNTSACRRSVARVCSRFSRSSNTSTASFIRSADAARSRKHSRASPNASASKSTSTSRSRNCSSRINAPSVSEPGGIPTVPIRWS